MTHFEDHFGSLCLSRVTNTAQMRIFRQARNGLDRLPELPATISTESVITRIILSIIVSRETRCNKAEPIS